MPNNNQNINQPTPKKSTFSIWSKRILGVIGVAGVIWGSLEGVYVFTEKYHEYEIYKTTVDSLDNHNQDFENRLLKIEKYVNQKRSSFAVGFRVVTVIDEETGRKIKKKTYRGWDGVVHTVYKDGYLSDMEGIAYYFWIGEDGERNYCW